MRMQFQLNDSAAVLAAMNRSLAIIEFDLTGKILEANENFCAALGYRRDEIVGNHHRMFVDPEEVASPDYRLFWEKLSQGQYDQRQYRRIGKGGREIWIEASYNPVFRRGKPYKVVKFATDITAIKLKAAEDAGKLDALSRAQAVIEFKPTGEILTANENFLETLGYELGEIVGKHHSMFCDPDYVKSDAYQHFWQRLAAGEFVTDEFMRLGRGGRKVYIQASYNPIFGLDGKVFKVVKFASDVTGRVQNVLALGEGLQALAARDLRPHLHDPFIPSLDQLRADFNQTASNLRSAMSSIQQNARVIAASSAEVSTSAQDLAQRTERQAATVEETAASLDQLTQTVADTSTRADEAGRLVEATRKHAEKSGDVVGKAIAAVGAIDQSSKEISNIIGVIDEIAFQTNLLALNAGVEAARAGDAGRGFAVVAQEVRALAQRSASAAKEIKTLITLSSSQVKTGVELVGETGQSLGLIVQQITEINAHVAAIVQGAREQAGGIKQINGAVNAMDQGTQHNAAMVEESTAAAHNLAKESAALFSLLALFRLQDEPGTVETTLRQPLNLPANQGSQRMASRISMGNAAVAEQWEDF
ncbi:methyl-accepting chemotaxis protein [Rhizobium oryzicola]|uniref:PAS domain-containing methyl-accepting chemotaxis protein n=1 Tax=Rhizobium oryzicola TaxID=1232668 RepID=A0ABT8STG3_9HYPH|nr:PAS domain-containing methyl-accepting chemotaxis protein [Rhizobium oryzicola]MDO1581328.1 PAS domain-containing methyl-accepting chemotaxis protein [Rhizobium oryzicola]